MLSQLKVPRGLLELLETTYFKIQCILRDGNRRPSTIRLIYLPGRILGEKPLVVSNSSKRRANTKMNTPLYEKGENTNLLSPFDKNKHLKSEAKSFHCQIFENYYPLSVSSYL